MEGGMVDKAEGTHQEGNCIYEDYEDADRKDDYD